MTIKQKYSDSLIGKIKTREIDNGWYERQCHVCGNTIEVVRHDAGDSSAGDSSLDNCGACGHAANIAQSLYDFYLAARKTGIDPSMDDRAFRSYEAFLERFKGLAYFENWQSRQDYEWLQRYNSNLIQLRHSRGVVVTPEQARQVRQQMELREKPKSRYLSKQDIDPQIEREWEERRKNYYRNTHQPTLPKGRGIK